MNVKQATVITALAYNAFATNAFATNASAKESAQQDYADVTQPFTYTVTVKNKKENRQGTLYAGVSVGPNRTREDRAKTYQTGDVLQYRFDIDVKDKNNTPIVVKGYSAELCLTPQETWQNIDDDTCIQQYNFKSDSKNKSKLLTGLEEKAGKYTIPADLKAGTWLLYARNVSMSGHAMTTLPYDTFTIEATPIPGAYDEKIQKDYQKAGIGIRAGHFGLPLGRAKAYQSTDALDLKGGRVFIIKGTPGLEDMLASEEANGNKKKEYTTNTQYTIVPQERFALHGANVVKEGKNRLVISMTYNDSDVVEVEQGQRVRVKYTDKSSPLATAKVVETGVTDYAVEGDNVMRSHIQPNKFGSIQDNQGTLTRTMVLPSWEDNNGDGRIDYHTQEFQLMDIAEDEHGMRISQPGYPWYTVAAASLIGAGIAGVVAYELAPTQIIWGTCEDGTSSNPNGSLGQGENLVE